MTRIAISPRSKFRIAKVTSPTQSRRHKQSNKHIKRPLVVSARRRRGRCSQVARWRCITSAGSDVKLAYKSGGGYVAIFRAKIEDDSRGSIYCRNVHLNTLDVPAIAICLVIKRTGFFDFFGPKDNGFLVRIVCKQKSGR